MPSKLKTILESTYAKIIFGGLIGFCGVAAGIYATYALIGPDTTPHPDVFFNGDQRKQIMKEQNMYPLVERGDLFPLEDFQHGDSSIGNFETLLTGQPSVLLFVHFECTGCRELLWQWKTTVKPRLKKEVQVLVLAGHEPQHLPEEFVPLVDGNKLLFIDRGYFRDIYRFSVWPTAVAVDEYGLITDIQVGFPNKFDKQLLDRISNPAR